MAARCLKRTVYIAFSENYNCDCDLRLMMFLSCFFQICSLFSWIMILKKKKKKKKEQFNCDSYRIFLGFVLKEEGERRRRRRGERRRRRSKGRKPKDFLVESKQNIEGQADQSS